MVTLHLVHLVPACKELPTLLIYDKMYVRIFLGGILYESARCYQVG